MLGTQQAELSRAQELLSGYRRKPTVSRPELKRLDKQARSALSAWLERKFRYAGLDQKQKKSFFVRISLEAMICTLLAALLGSSFPFLALMAIYIAEFSVLSSLASKRAQKFEKDYTALLISLASAIRTGQDPILALSESGYLFDQKAEISNQLLQFKEDIDSGLPEEKAIKRFARSIAHPDIDLFRQAMILSRREGSSLSHCLQRLAKVVRQRQSFRRKVKVSVAMQKLSAYGIAGCTVVIGLIQYTANPDALKEALVHPIGSILLFSGVGLVLVGLVWMRLMVTSRY